LDTIDDGFTEIFYFIIHPVVSIAENGLTVLKIKIRQKGLASAVHSRKCINIFFKNILSKKYHRPYIDLPHFVQVEINYRLWKAPMVI